MPNLITLDNEEAKIVVGQNVPFVTGQYAGATGVGATVNPFQTIERKDVGLSLNVRPQISQGGTIKLAIYQETSDVSPTSNASDIITDKRSIQTNVLADDGQIIVLGGLIDDNGNDTVEKVPALGDIPLIGGLFRYKSRNHTKRNLMVFLRPTIIRSNEQSVTLSADRYDYMRDVQTNALPEHTIILPNLGLQRMPELQQGKLVDGPLYRNMLPPQDAMPKEDHPAASPSGDTAPPGTSSK
jgi:general secretion pathway protein D